LLIYFLRVRTDSGKVWKVLEFNVEIFKALKSLENDHRYRKVKVQKFESHSILRIEEYIV